MAKKKGSFSIDEMLGDYAEEKKRRSDSQYEHGKPSEMVASAKEERAEAAARKREELVASSKPLEKEYYERPERLGDSGAEEERIPKEMVRSKAVLIFTYALRSFAIALMLMLMLFVIFHDVMKKRPVIDYFSSIGDSFTDFALTYIGFFAMAFAVPFLLQLAYDALYWVANKKWKAHTREEIIHAILFALIGLIGSGLIIWAMKIY